MPEEYVLVYTANGRIDAAMIRGFLQSNGFSVITAGESIGEAYGLTITPLGNVDVYVPQSQGERARQVLAAMERGDYELPDDPLFRTDDAEPPDSTDDEL